MTRPFASVLIDTFNHERFIEEAVVSVLEQDFPAAEREILVVDDGSTDRTPEILKKFAPGIRILRKENGGQASAFNAGIPECRGEIVAFLDGDDWWAKEKLTSVVQAMADDATVGIVGHGIIIVGRDGNEQPEILREGFRFRAKTVEGGKLFRRRGSFLGTSRMTIRSSLLRQIGAVPEAIQIQADEYLFTLAAAMSEAQILQRALTYYRLHDGNQFLLADPYDPQKLRHKYNSLVVLVRCIPEKLAELGLEKEVIRTVLGYTAASTDQLRLLLDGGWPWETVRTEWGLYRITHSEAPLSHRAFKCLSLLGALLTTPKRFYAVHRAVTRSGLYRRARQRWLPIPTVQHIEKESVRDRD